MKKFVFVVLAILMTFVATMALAGSGAAPAVGNVNVPLTVPKTAKAVCTTMTAGKTGAATVTVSGTTMASWKAFASDTDATAVTVKRKLGSNTAYMPASGESNLPIAAGVSTLTFTKFSSATNSATPRICADLN